MNQPCPACGGELMILGNAIVQGAQVTTCRCTQCEALCQVSARATTQPKNTKPATVRGGTLTQLPEMRDEFIIPSFLGNPCHLSCQVSELRRGWLVSPWRLGL